jgi:hypothetical protein
MGGQRFRTLFLLAALGGIGWWIYEKRPTLSGVVETLTRPLLGSRAAVKTSERKRVVGEASQVVVLDEEKPVGTVQEGMSESDVRRLLGEPDAVEDVLEDAGPRRRWTYRSLGRVIVFEGGRVLSVAVR